MHTEEIRPLTDMELDQISGGCCVPCPIVVAEKILKTILCLGGIGCCSPCGGGGNTET